MDFVAAFLNLEKEIEACDFVVTGEGSFDEQTLEGKAVI
jgi:glycerate kinase